MSRRRVVLLVSLAVCSLSSIAYADATSDAVVALRREAPYADWCVAPICPSGRGSRLDKLPRAVSVGDRGLLEARLRRSLTEAFASVAEQSFAAAYDEGLADVADALAAAAAGDSSRVNQLGGLAGAAVRAGLVRQLDRALPQIPGCSGARRLDAIYEGLAISVALAPLGFPKKTGRVLAACERTGEDAARLVDQAVLKSVTAAGLAEGAISTAKQIEEVLAHCLDPEESRVAAARFASNPSGLRTLTVDRAAGALRAQAARPPAAAAGSACDSALDVFTKLDPAPLESLAGEGLGGASVAALAGALASADSSNPLLVRIASGAMTEADARTLVSGLAGDALASVHAAVFDDALAVLPQAVVVDGGGGPPTLDPNAVLSALAARYGVDDDGHPTLRGLLLGGTSPWVVELNGGVPQVDFSQQKVVADASLGYATKRFGIVGRGWIDTYDLDDATSHNDYTRAGGSLEGFWLSGETAKRLRVEVRAAGGFDYYDTTTYPLKDALSQFYDYDSRIGRGSALVGVRYGTPTDRVSAQLLVGGGFQYEDPDTTHYTGGKNVALTSDQNLTAQATGRFFARVRIVPQIVGLRLRAESLYFAITRESISAVASAGSATTTSVAEQQQQIEVHTRLFADADVASFGGFVPAIYAGGDYIGIQGRVTTTSKFVPIVGIGIVRHTW